MKIGTISPSSTGVINNNYIPEILVLKTGTLTNVSSLKVQVFGTVGLTVDLDNTGLALVDAMGQVKDDDTSYTISLSNGKHLGKNCDLTIVNASSTQNIEVFGYGTRKGTHFVKHFAQSYVANNSPEFSKFVFLGIPTIASTDLVTVTFNVFGDDGAVVGEFTEQMTRDEILSMSGMYMYKTGYFLNNTNQMIKSVKFNITADTKFYVSKIVDSEGSDKL